MAANAFMQRDHDCTDCERCAAGDATCARPSVRPTARVLSDVTLCMYARPPFPLQSPQHV
ncbi:hypothetical protein EON67_11575 [archaeon]|nr:MAG: hypothetical protein EON67_11575 [archaeon]